LRSPYLAAIPPVVALAAGLLRWTLQGSGNLYTATSRRAYLPDPDLGWRVVEGGPPWLGLEILGVILAVACAIVAGAWLIGRLERGGPRPLLRGLLWAVAIAPLAVPAWAFSGGFGPDGARDALPRSAGEGPSGGDLAGALDAPAGRWEVVEHTGSAITARVSAGGEAFDARFARGITGHWTGDPRDLRAPMSAAIEVPAAAIDTGVELRTKDARDEYLQASRYPRLTFRLDRLLSAEPRGDGQIAFRAAGTIGLIGREHAVEATGALRRLDDAARARLRLPPGAPALLAEADFPIRIRETALAADASDFDGDEIPVHVTLVLLHQGED
jgi:polyisoprenoid-binding protein YceI